MRTDLREKTILVYGTGRSGIGAAKLLLAGGARPVLFDENKEVDIARIREQIGAEVEVLTGDLPEHPAGHFALAVISPGVPLDTPRVLALREAGLPIWGEVELAWQMGSGRVFAVTGTNGKTTTTALLGKIFADYYPETYVVGNIGRSYAEAAAQMSDVAVTAVEVSSFQLETIDAFHPSGSVITNITPDHLNRHHTMEEYIRVKERIAENQGSDDLCVLNMEDPVLLRFGQSGIAPRVAWFSSARPVRDGLYLADGVIRIAEGGAAEDFVRTEELQLLGAHNMENIMCAVALALHAGVPVDSIRESVCRFAGVEHRIEFVLERDGVRYYNDSKGTNPDAAIKAIRAMNRPTLLIGGGYDKDATYGEWIDAFDGKVKEFVLIGQTREKIAKEAAEHGFPAERMHLFDELEQAVHFCMKRAESGDAVLLSPACASWGQFADYEERGNVFKELVRAR